MDVWQVGLLGFECFPLLVDLREDATLSKEEAVAAENGL